MERVPVDGDDRPEREIKITGASVFVNPYKDMEEEERQKADAERRQVGPITCVLGYGVGYHTMLIDQCCHEMLSLCCVLSFG